MDNLLGQSVQSAQELAGASWIPLAASVLALVGGLVLWLAGSRVLRSGFVFIGLFFGSLTGYLAGSAVAMGIDPIWFGAFGLITGGLLGWLMFRAAVALSMALILGVAVTVITGSTVALSNADHDTLVETEQTLEMGPPAPENTQELLQDLWDRMPPLMLDDPAPPEVESLFEEIQQARDDFDLLARAGAFTRDLATDLQPLWDDMPVRSRLLLAGSYIGGFLIGLFVGIAAPRRAAAATTAFLGPAIWLPSAVFAIDQLQLTHDAWLPTRPLHWLGIWGGAVVIGLFVQWTGSKPNADKA